ncbi:V-type proton ATPase subunit e [Drosophila busckii]|uniref:V-type proton ATPase subunit e n=1 Tax=Drosophila busckii TaxID=30019 RepID=UPI00083F40C7|nr:V-type proton ATPase subunit e [Drosophila busckii]
MNKYVSLGVFTGFWVIFGIVGFFVAKRFKEVTIIRCCVLLSAVCCWLLWLVTFLMQLNPLIGPRAKQVVIYGIMTYWKNSYIHDKNDP